MGIDIYMRWPDQTPDEEQAQYTGFNVTAGAVGYLREAYHGEPYATYDFVAEAFAAEDSEASIPAAVLRDRLPVAQERTRVRYKDVPWAEEAVQSFADFVALAEAKEAEHGVPVTIIASY